MKFSTITPSHSNHPLLHLNSHFHSSSIHTPMFPTISPCCYEFRKSRLYLWARLSPPLYLSNQNIVSNLFPSFHIIKPSTHFNSFSPSYIFFRSLHQIEAFGGSSSSTKSLHLPYFDSNTSHHNSHFWWYRFHLHLAIKASLNKHTSLIPSPPWLLGEHICSHLTQEIFLSSFSLSHKNLACKLWIFFATTFGILKMAREKVVKNTKQSL